MGQNAKDYEEFVDKIGKTQNRHKTAKIHMEASLHHGDVLESWTNWRGEVRNLGTLLGTKGPCGKSCHLAVFTGFPRVSREGQAKHWNCQQEHRDAGENWTVYCLTPADTQLRDGRFLPGWQDLGARKMRLLTACSGTVRRDWLQTKVIYFESLLALLSLFSLHWEVRRRAFQFH